MYVPMSSIAKIYLGHYTIGKIYIFNHWQPLPLTRQQRYISAHSAFNSLAGSLSFTPARAMRQLTRAAAIAAARITAIFSR